MFLVCSRDGLGFLFSGCKDRLRINVKLSILNIDYYPTKYRRITENRPIGVTRLGFTFLQLSSAGLPIVDYIQLPDTSTVIDGN